LRPSSVRMTCAAFAASLAFGSACAEDIDLFTSASGGTGQEPNILIVLDNSANWSRADQQWPIGKQGESELRAIYNLLGDSAVGTNINLGLMMFSSSGGGEPAGGYVRFHIRNMNADNKAAFRQLIGDATCLDGLNTLNNTPNCILKNFDNPTEKIGSASSNYSGVMFDVFKYFGGYTDPAHATLDQAGTPTDRNHFGPLRYGAPDPKADRDAYTNGTKTSYASPIRADGTNSCAKNFIIFIGNGYPANDAAATLLTGINGDAAVPAPIGSKSNRAANWAKYVFTTDVNSVLGTQNVRVYTIDVFNAKPDPDNQTPLLKGMAKYGGGRYFEAKNEESILAALKEVIIEIQAANSVFASASLPINATNRSQNENQVFIGMFRPDPDAKPRWYGNLKQYQIALFGGDARLADKDGKEAIAATTGFVQACASSFWTVASGTYWNFSPDSQGTCGTVANSAFSDLPDGPTVEKGGAGEVLRRGNNPSATAPFGWTNRTMYTCGTQPCGSLTSFDTASVTQARTGAATLLENTGIVEFTRGKDVNNEDGNVTALGLPITDEPRPSIHGDIAHSRPLPVNYGGSRGVVVYYGANDGTFKAVEGATGKELWSFVAPEHHSKLKRLYQNTTLITYPGLSGPGALPKDYFFDGASGLYQNADNSRVWIFPTMRRGGRMLYAFDVTNTTPVLKWSKGCPRLDTNDGCSSGFEGIGQTWSGTNVAFVDGYSTTRPVVIVGGGYDACLDVDSPTTTCSATSMGSKVYVLDADTGAIVGTPFNTDAPVAADVTLINRDFIGGVDHAYVADALGSMYRIDFADPSTGLARAPGSWTITKIAYSNTGNRKFLFAPAALVVGLKVYLAVGSGDRERPLRTNYPFTTPITNRFYSFVDSFTNTAYDLNGSTLENFSSATGCATTVTTGKNGWYMDLADGGIGEQTVTSAVIFGGTIFFSTNRPVPPAIGSCTTNLGEARGYAVNLFNASGVIGTGQLCGGARSGIFTGGGIPPSPVVGVVPVVQPDGTSKPTNVLIGGIDLERGSGSPIGAQEPKVPLKQIRSRVYWYPQGDR
jgi:type IV pilus assembly protein PilY1